MLNVGAPRRPAPAAGAAVLVAAFPGAVRALPLATVAAVLAGAALPMLATVARAGDPAGALVAAAVVGGTVAAFAVDDPAGATLAPVPTTLARRRLLRLAGLAVGLAAAWALTVILAATRGPLTGSDLALRAAEAWAVSGVAAGVAGRTDRRGIPSAALAGALSGALAVLLVSSLAWRVTWLPAVGMPANHHRWWLIGAAGWAAAVWSSRDPARR